MNQQTEAQRKVIGLALRLVVGILTFVVGVASFAVWIIAYQPGQMTMADDRFASKALEEYAVYSVLLNEVYVRPSTDQVIIGEETSLDWVRGDHLKHDLEVLRKATHNSIALDTIDAFQADNLQPQLLTNHFNLRVSCIILNKKEVDAIDLTRDGWGTFLDKYPYHGLITLSRIGFNREMDQALAYTGTQSGGKSGRGEFVFLRKEKNGWTIKNRVFSWVS